ncbi:reverse transcriptase [Operophtera brumata]|uniref:Reverse transcriptase n=1 Tax=Operophtera brumata TaxID=104452 RepID=A0A0L7L9C9_OPEBR|nr:reverse transcriptase [Operophtera brumata]
MRVKPSPKEINNFEAGQVLNSNRLLVKFSSHMAVKIHKMLACKAIVKCSSESGFLSPLFLRVLNNYLRPPKFRLINHHRTPLCLNNLDYMIKIDLSQAYFNIPISKPHRRFLAFNFDNRYNGEGNQSYCLFRRLPSITFRSRHFIPTKSVCSKALVANGMVHKLPKDLRAIMSSRVSGTPLEHRTKHQTKNPEMYCAVKKFPGQPMVDVVACKSFVGEHELRKKNIQSSNADGSKLPMNQKHKRFSRIREPEMVAKTHLLFISDPPTRSNGVHNNRCCDNRVGRYSRKGKVEWSLEQEEMELAQ